MYDNHKEWPDQAGDHMTVNYPQQQRRKRKVWPWVVGGLAFVVLVACGIGVALVAAGGSALEAVQTEVSKEANRRLNDVAITKCQLDSSTSTVTVAYTVHNTDDNTQDYMIELDLLGPDKKTRIGTANGFEQKVKPGATVKGEALGFVTGSPTGLTCVLTGA